MTTGPTSSERRRIANAKNAQQSTGPRTPRGLNQSSRNATRHGLYAKRELLQGEDADEYASLAEALVESLRPSDALEEVLVDRVVSLAWRLRRMERIESGLLTIGASARGADLSFAVRSDALAGDSLTKQSSIEAGLERRLYRVLQELDERRALRTRKNAELLGSFSEAEVSHAGG